MDKGALANELGHKLVHDRGLFNVFPSDLGTVSVSGTLRLLVNRRFRKVRSCTVTARQQDAEFAHSVVVKQHALLSKDLRFNLCHVDVPTSLGSLDLVGYFTTKKNYGCSGRVWVDAQIINFVTNLF